MCLVRSSPSAARPWARSTEPCTLQGQDREPRTLQAGGGCFGELGVMQCTAQIAALRRRTLRAAHARPDLPLAARRHRCRCAVPPAALPARWPRLRPVGHGATAARLPHQRPGLHRRAAVLTGQRRQCGIVLGFALGFQALCPVPPPAARATPPAAPRSSPAAPAPAWRVRSPARCARRERSARTSARAWAASAARPGCVGRGGRLGVHRGIPSAVGRGLGPAGGFGAGGGASVRIQPPPRPGAASSACTSASTRIGLVT
jgi:hypothetical protein